MDNVTHSLIGATMGEGIRRLPGFKERSPKLLSAIFWAAIIGNNLPDADIVYTGIRGIVGVGKLAYLLEHRGYTHTLIVAPALAVVTMFVSAALCGVKGWRGLTRSDWRALFWVSFASVLLHIGMDYLNDYGVHPFAPFWSHWIYGGVLFIVEPLLLAALLPLLIVGLSSKEKPSKTAQVFGIALSSILLALVWLTKIVTWPVALATTLFLALGLWVQKHLRGLAQPLGFAALVLFAFTYAGHEVTSRVRNQIAVEQPEENVIQLVTTPSPGNPFCWKVIPVSRLELDGMAGQVSGQVMTPFFERLGVVSLWPSLFPPESCAFRANVERTAPLMKASLSSSDGIFWIGEFRGTTESLMSAAAQYCRFEQFLHWSRVPFYFKTSASTLLGGDLRYDHEPGLGFAEIEFAQGEPCLAHVPSWDSPAGLLQSGPRKTQ